MSSKSVRCPNCGAESVGKFCGECGAKLRLTCPSCGKNAPSGAKFCPECGASLGGAGRRKDSIPWIAVGAAGVVFAIVGTFTMVDRQQGGIASSTPTAATATTVPGITPVEAAEQLFNHVMAASERGDTEEAKRFAPMALEAYRQLARLDNDAHYHVGLIHVTIGETDAAETELQAIRRSVPDHLLGIMLEEAIAEAKGDDEGVSRAYQHFLSAYDKEITAGREEYDGHRTGIDGFHARASAAAANH